jgi:large subunit ribosomal protein L29
VPLLRIKDIRDMSSDDRTKKLDEFRTELLRLRTMIRAGGTVENPARVKTLRKAIAKILTIEHEERHGTNETEQKKTKAKKTEPKKSKSIERKKR